MGFDPWNCSLKIQKSIGTLTPKVGAHLGVWRFIPSNSPTLPGAWNVTIDFHTWPTPSQALALIVSPRLRFQHEMYWVKTMYVEYKLYVFLTTIRSHVCSSQNITKFKKTKNIMQSPSIKSFSLSYGSDFFSKNIYNYAFIVKQM